MAKTARKKHTKKKASGKNREPRVEARNRPLRDLTDEALRNYFKDLNGYKPGDLYELVLGEVEPPLFQAVMDFTQGNQSRAAEILGINRATLRKKLKYYHLVH